MYRFQDFLESHFIDDPEEINHLSMDEIKNYVLDYLAVELWQYEDEDYENNVDLYCDKLKSYIEDENRFYYSLLVDIVNISNHSGNKGIILQLADENQFHEDEHHYFLSMEKNMKNAFLFFFHHFEKEKESEK